MYLITYTIKHGEYEYGDRFLFDSCDYADILPEIYYGFSDYTLGDFRTAVADLRLDNRHEIDDRVLCDLAATKVDDADVAMLSKYLIGTSETRGPIVASLVTPNIQ
jgi:hypothetical protein